MSAPPAYDHVRVIDFETDGLTADSHVVEAAYVDVIGDGTKWGRAEEWSSLVNPGRPIDVRAMAVHHITDDEVKDAPAFTEIMGDLGLIAFERPVRVFAAHNAAFEQQFYKPPDAEWICTWKCALTAWPEAPGHKNQELRYWIGMKLKPELCARPHRAPDDAYVTAAILVRMLATTTLTVERMIQISAGPVVLPYLAFGMHAMKPIAEIPTSYLEWMIKQADMDANARKTAFHHLTLRRQQ